MEQMPENNYQSSWPEIDRARTLQSQASSVKPNQTPMTNNGNRSGKRTAIVLTAIALVAIVIAAGFYFFEQLQSPSVSLTFLKPNQVFVGQPFSVEVSFGNNSGKLLHNARLALTLPDGMAFVGQSPDTRVMEQTVGDIGPQSINQQRFDLIAVRSPQTSKNISATLRYGDANNNQVNFEQKGGFDILIGQPAITLNFTAPKDVISNTNLDLVVTYQNNTEDDFRDLHLKINYQPIFQFGKASIDPSRNNSEWDLPSLPAGTNGTLTITGKAVGQEGSFFGFDGVLTGTFQGQQYTITDQKASIAIATSPLSMKVVANNDPNYISHIGDQMSYTITYKNNTDTIMQNAVIRATLLGELFDFTMNPSTVASFNSLTNTFTWLAANTPELTSISPGQEGSVTISIPLKQSFPIQRLSDKNYTLKLNASIESPTALPDTNLQKTSSMTSIESRVRGDVKLDAQAYWHDAKSGIANSGPYPPRTNQATQYTIHWVVKNYATDVNNVKVSGYLQSGAECTGTTKSNTSAQPICDPNTGLVTWAVGNLVATKGVAVGSAPAEAIFQVTLTPATNQGGQSPQLLAQSTLEADDIFTNTHLTASDGPLDISIPDDTTIQTDRRVQP